MNKRKVDPQADPKCGACRGSGKEYAEGPDGELCEDVCACVEEREEGGEE